MRCAWNRIAGKQRNAMLASIAFLLALFAIATTAHADTFHLLSGGEVEGEWLNANQPAAKIYEVRLASGGTIKLAAEQVRETVKESPDVAEYRRIAPTHANTVEAQWQLAQWCFQHKLARERVVHLQRVLDLDADHPQARRGLGYSFVKGQWVQSEQWRKENGYQRYDGRWMLPQEIEIRERQKKQDLAEKEWASRLRRMRTALADPEKQRAAQEEFAAIRDSNAAKPLAELLMREQFQPVKLMLVETLGQLGEAGTPTLLAVSLADHDQDVRYACVDQLEKIKPANVQKYYLKVLQGNDNWQVNRAAYALGRLGDQTSLSPLIDALITTHAYTTQSGNPGNGSGDAVSTSFSPGGTSFSAGSSPKTFRVNVQNEDVLRSLVILSNGVSFNYDIPRWRAWLAARSQAEGK